MSAKEATKNSLGFLENFKKAEENFKFFRFDHENDYFHGLYMGFKEITSSLTGEVQVVWIAKAVEDYFEQEVFKNDLVYIPEKSAMVQKRMLLKEGQEFALVYVGEKKSKTGRKYKSFDLYYR